MAPDRGSSHRRGAPAAGGPRRAPPPRPPRRALPRATSSTSDALFTEPTSTMPRRASARVSSGRPGLPNGVGLRNEADTRTVRPARQSPARTAAPPPPIESRTPPRAESSGGWPGPGWPEGQRHIRRAGLQAGIARRRHHARDVQRDRRAERRQRRVLAQHAFEEHRRVSSVGSPRVEPLEQSRAIRGTRARRAERRPRRPHNRSPTASATPCGSSSARKPRPASSDSTAAPAAQSGSQPSGLIGEQDAGGGSGNERDSGDGRGSSHAAERAREVTEVSEGPGPLQHGATEKRRNGDQWFFP